MLTFAHLTQVDDLVEIGALESYVRRTACMLLFLSRGYFRSQSESKQHTAPCICLLFCQPCGISRAADCMREIQATVNESKPFVLVHEADAGHGGLTLEASKEECPDKLRELIFTHREYSIVGGSLRIKPQTNEAAFRPAAVEARARQVVTWMRIKADSSGLKTCQGDCSDSVAEARISGAWRGNGPPTCFLFHAHAGFPAALAATHLQGDFAHHTPLHGHRSGAEGQK